MNNPIFKNLFYPKSIALIWASRTPWKLWFDLLNNLIKHWYKWDIYPINPSASEILGKKVYSNIWSIKNKSEIDLAIIAVPAKIVLNSIKECITHKIKNYIIISAGFKEIWDEWITRENDLKELVKKHSLNLIWPNCLGIINTDILLNASFAEWMPKKWNIALISQSGAIAVAINDWASEKNLGFSKIISLWNKSWLDENDCLEYLIEDDATKVILIYIENFSDWKKFMDIATKLSTKKPIILFKSWISEKWALAVFSHTWALAWSNKVTSCALKKCWVIRANTIEDFFDFAQAFSMQSLTKWNKVAVVTNAWWLWVISTDLIDESSLLDMLDFSKNTSNLLEKNLPASASTHNPIDVVWDALSDRYEVAIKTILENERIDFLFVMLTPQVMTEKEDTARVIINYSKQYKSIAFFSSFVWWKNIQYAVEKLEEWWVTNFSFPSRAISSMNAMVFLSNWRKENMLTSQYLSISNKSKKEKIQNEINALQSSWIKQLPQNIINQIFWDLLFKYDKTWTSSCHYRAWPDNLWDSCLRRNDKRENLPVNSFKIDFAQIYIVKNENELVNIGNKIWYPVALKIFSDKSSHKSDIWWVVLWIEYEHSLVNEYKKLINKMKLKLWAKESFNIGIQRMHPKWNEFIVWMKRDPNFGPVIMVWTWWILVEVIKDISLDIAPISKENSLKMIDQLKFSKVINWIRWQKPLDSEFISDLMCAISEISINFPEIQEIDINPLIIYEKWKGGVVVDVRMKI